MPNRSIPSRACEPCRRKRRKCDLKQPCCSQCIRARVSCSGYRDEFSLHWQDETAVTSKKVRVKKGKDTPLSQDVVIFSENLDDAVTTKGLTNARVFLTPEHTSLSFFMQHYASYSLFDYLPDFYKLGFDKSIEEAVLVPSMALVSHQMKDADLLKLAAARYAKLVKKTQQAQANPERAKSDGTLIAVLCMALFEAMSLHGNSMQSNQETAYWNADINELAALLELRGPQQYDGWLGQTLYIHANHSISASCAIKMIPAPAALLHVDRTAPSDDPKYLLALRRGRFLRTWAEYRQQKPFMSEHERLQKWKFMLDDINDQLQEMALVDPIEPLDSASFPLSAKLYLGGADLYSSIRWAQAWNILCMFQIFISYAAYGCLEECHSKSAYMDTSTEMAFLSRLRPMLTQKIRDAIGSILRSVPFFINLSGEPRFTTRSLIGPLYSVASCKLASPEALDQLYVIGNSYDMTPAIKAAKSVEDGELNPYTWMILSHLC